MPPHLNQTTLYQHCCLMILHQYMFFLSLYRLAGAPLAPKLDLKYLVKKIQHEILTYKYVFGLSLANRCWLEWFLVVVWVKKVNTRKQHLQQIHLWRNAWRISQKAEMIPTKMYQGIEEHALAKNDVAHLVMFFAGWPLCSQAGYSMVTLFL